MITVIKVERISSSGCCLAIKIPVEFEHRLERHPAIVKLQLFFEELVPWKVVIAKVILQVRCKESFFKRAKSK